MATHLFKFGRVVSGYSHLLNCRTLKRFDQCLRSVSRTAAALVDRRYSNTHEWISVEGKTGVVGISAHAQEALGDIVYAQLPDPDTEFSQSDECGTLESVKAASALYSPVSGKVTEKNTLVEENPGTINKSCYEDGWLFKIELSNPEELKKLMDEDAYQSFLKAEESHH